MNSKDLVQLRRKIGLLGRLTDQLNFIYSSVDSDGFPGLLIDETIPAKSIVAFRRRVQVTDFVRGVLKRDTTGVICFHIHKGNPDSILRLRTHLDGILTEQIPAFLGARVTGEP